MTSEKTAAWLVSRAQEKGFADHLRTLLFDLCAQPSVPGPDVGRAAREEGRVFARLAAALAERGLPGVAENRPIRPDIVRHRAFTPPYYAPDGDAYRGRSNLVHVHAPAEPPAAGRSVALNAHVDTVAPWFPPRVEGGTLFGRGACDDKGSCAAIVGALALLRALADEHGIRPRGRIVSMFVIDEETGGNGSLSLALDAGLARQYDTLLVIEATEGQLHPANRGAVWYRAAFPGGSPERLRLALETVLELEEAGRALKADSDHPLFPDRPVQTCHGILGPYGEHPSAICGKVAFRLPRPADGEAVRRALDAGLAAYVSGYGDKTKVTDPRSGAPKVARHYDLERRGDDLLLTVWGSTGHMGAILENDGAITKAAFMLLAAWEAVPGFAAHLEAADRTSAVPHEPGTAEVRPAQAAGPLLLEGGQGFLPTHDIGAVEERLRRAAAAAFERAAGGYGYRGGRPEVTFDKLHNDAFDGDPDSPAMRAGLRAAGLTGIPVRLPVRGMKVSCDARLFAKAYPQKTVITVGPGTLEVAHSDAECIDLAELARSCAFLALYLLLLTGTLEEG